MGDAYATRTGEDAPTVPATTRVVPFPNGTRPEPMRRAKLSPHLRLSWRCTAVGSSNAKSIEPPPGNASDTRRTLPEKMLTLPGV